MYLISCSHHVTYVFQSQSTFYICLNMKELFARNRPDMGSLSNCKGTQTHNHLVRKRTLTHLAKLTKSLSWVSSTYLYRAFHCMFLSCYVRVSEWIHTLYLPDCQGISCPKRRYISSLSNCNGTGTFDNLVVNEHSKIWPNWRNDWAESRVLIWTVQLTVCSYHVT